jgi:hypothetical protein
MKMKRSENETKKKRNLLSFPLRSDMKRNRSEICFLFDAKKMFETEMKRKKKKKKRKLQSEKG